MTTMAIFQGWFDGWTVWNWLSLFIQPIVAAPFVIYAVLWLYRRMGWDIKGKKH